MLYFTENKGKCTGCSACVAACPVGCIHMEKDSEGFLYPVSSEACINCGKCERVCPVTQKGESENIPVKAYCGVTKDKAIWQRSASGGAFSEICLANGDEKTIVAGAVWNGLSVEHRIVEGVENIAPLCKSKYVASDMKNTFKELRESLEDGKKAIFCGTPCQVAGLKSYLGKGYENLLLIDFVCHGVGSPAVFEACIQETGKALGENVVSYEFRAKRNVFETDYMSKVTTEKGKEHYISGDAYIQLFLKQTCLRPSCGKNCIFRNEHRQGDITVADFKHLLKVFPNLTGTKKNYSTIVANNEKGLSAVELLNGRMDLTECDIEIIKENNPLFARQTLFSEDRDGFFEEFIASPQETIEKRTEPFAVLKQSFAKKLWALTPVFARKISITAVKKLLALIKK